MAYPSSLTLVTVTGTFVRDGRPESGRVIFRNGVAMRNRTTKETLRPIRRVVRLDQHGSFSVQLPASNDPDWEPVGFTWRVTQQFRYGGSATFNILLPHNGGPVDLADVSPLAQVPGVQMAGTGITSVNAESGPNITLTPEKLGAASLNHTHAAYAAALHVHSGYAVEGHTHLDTTRPLPVTLQDTPTIATDAGLANHFRVLLGGNRTLGTPTNGRDGQRVIWEFVQDDTGNRNVTLGAAFVQATGQPFALTATKNKRDFMTAVYNDATQKWYVLSLNKGY